jgi:hypothetical protein
MQINSKAVMEETNMSFMKLFIQLLTGVCLCFLVVTITPNNALGGPNCDLHPLHSSCTGSGDDGVTGTIRVRVQMREDWADYDYEGGIFPDNVDTCIIDSLNTYEYWDYGDIGLIGDPPYLPGSQCTFHPIRSDVSGGGRWFLMLPGKGQQHVNSTRWLTVDFSDSTNGAPCPDLDGKDYYILDEFVDENDEPVVFTDNNPCVDHVAVWLKAEKALHNRASRTPLLIILWSSPDDDGYWQAFAGIDYINPLYLRTPEEGDVGYGTGCRRVISTEPGEGDPEDSPSVRAAEMGELAGWDRPEGWPDDVARTYNLPFEACLTKAK